VGRDCSVTQHDAARSQVVQAAAVLVHHERRHDERDEHGADQTRQQPDRAPVEPDDANPRQPVPDRGSEQADQHRLLEHESTEDGQRGGVTTHPHLGAHEGGNGKLTGEPVDDERQQPATQTGHRSRADLGEPQPVPETARLVSTHGPEASEPDRPPVTSSKQPGDGADMGRSYGLDIRDVVAARWPRRTHVR